jgi:hypothetical protein
MAKSSRLLCLLKINLPQMGAHASDKELQSFAHYDCPPRPGVAGSKAAANT